MIPKISVIIPVYNSEKYIEQCLDSIVNQTLKDIEIIVIDDGSTDGSADICDRYAKIDTRIKLIHKNNEGQGVARNVGINEATGEFIGFIDSDDKITLNFYEKLYENVKKYDADVACGKIVKLFPNMTEEIYGLGLYLKSSEQLLENFDKKKYLIYTNLFVDKIARKELFDKYDIKFYENGIFEDTPIGLYIALASDKVVYNPEVTYYYNQNHNSTMHNIANKTFMIFNILNYIHKNVDNYFSDIYDFTKYKQIMYERDIRQLFYFTFSTDISKRNDFLKLVLTYIKSNNINIKFSSTSLDIFFRYIILKYSGNHIIFSILAYIYYSIYKSFILSLKYIMKER